MKNKIHLILMKFKPSVLDTIKDESLEFQLFSIIVGIKCIGQDVFLIVYTRPGTGILLVYIYDHIFKLAICPVSRISSEYC